MNTSSTSIRKILAALMAVMVAIAIALPGFKVSAASAADGPSAVVRALDWNNDGVFNYKDPIAALRQGGVKLAPVVGYMKDLLKNKALPRAKVLVCASYKGASAWCRDHKIVHKSVVKIDGKSQNWALLDEKGKVFEIVINTRKKTPYYPK